MFIQPHIANCACPHQATTNFLSLPVSADRSVATLKSALLNKTPRLISDDEETRSYRRPAQPFPVPVSAEISENIA